MRGPSFAMARFTYRFSSVRLKLFSALAMADHDRQDHRGARPGLHDLLLVARVQDVDLLFQGLLDEGALLYRPAHLDFLFGGRSVTNRSVRGLLRVLRPIAGLPQGVCA